MGNEQSGAAPYRADYRAHAPAPARQESAADKAERLQRAAAYEDKMKKFQRKDPEQLKQENWKKYDAIGRPADADGTSNSTASLPPSSSSASVPAPPSHWNTTSSANRPPPAAVQAGYPGAAANHVQSAKRATTGGSGYVGSSTTSASPIPSQSSSTPPLPFDPNRARAARAAAMGAKTSKMKPHSKPGGKTDQWETYRQLEALEAQKTAAVAVSDAPRYRAGVYADVAEAEAEEIKGDDPDPSSTASPVSPAIAALLPPPPPESDAAATAFYQQMFHLLSLAQRMPESSLSLLIKILANLLKADSTADGHKFRKLKLDSEKIQREVVAVEGALDILYAVGFETVAVEGGDESLVCPVGTDMRVASLALEKLQAVAAAKR